MIFRLRRFPLEQRLYSRLRSLRRTTDETKYHAADQGEKTEDDLDIIRGG